MRGPRQALRETSQLLHQWWYIYNGAMVVLGVAFMVATCIVHYPFKSPYLFAQLLVMSLAVFLRLIGEVRAATWIFSLGGIVAEVVGSNAAATRPIEELYDFLELVSSKPLILPCLCAGLWFVGSVVHSSQPLRATWQIALGLLWLAAMGIRCTIIRLRCTDPLGALMFSRVFPCSLLPAVLGFFATRMCSSLATFTKVARQLEGAETQLAKSHRAWVDLVARFAQLRSMWLELPESIRLQYTDPGAEIDGLWMPPCGIPANAGAVDGNCVVCFEQPFTHAFVPCMHRCVCKDCADRLETTTSVRSCPLCRMPYTLCAQVFDP